MFALHCFLGKRYDHGAFFEETGKPSPGRANLREQPILLERAALLRMLCNYSTRVVDDAHRGSCYIYPQLLPGASRFDVTMEFKPIRNLDACAVERYTG